MFPDGGDDGGTCSARSSTRRRASETCGAVGFVLQNEPLTDPALADKIRLFRERVPDRVTAFIVTNGTLLDSPTARALLDSGLDAMHITCNGYAREDWEAINRGKSWDDFRENLEGFLAQDLSRLAVMMSFVRTNLYRQELGRAVRHWSSRGFFCFIHGVNNRGGLVDDYETFARPAAEEPLGLRLRKRAVKKVPAMLPLPFSPDVGAGRGPGPRSALMTGPGRRSSATSTARPSGRSGTERRCARSG